MLERMYPTKIWERWGTFFNAHAMGFWFIEDIANIPHETVNRIATFLGGSALAGGANPEINTKASNKKVQLRDEVRAELAQLFFDEITACAKLFGSHAISWKEKYSKLG